MPANALLSPHDAPGAWEPLLDSTGPGVDADRAVIEHAKGALMLRYGIDSHQAFAVMVRWSRVTLTPVHTIAHTLVHGICEGNPQTEVRHRALMRWLEDQLRHNDPDLAGPTRVPVG